jgi:lipoprotein-anchoring transpeptidase ErfK/SrfK
MGGKKRIKYPFLLLLPVALVFAGMVLFVSGKRFLSQRPCGCGPLVADPTGEFEPAEKRAFFDNQPVSYPGDLLASLRNYSRISQAQVLGETTDDRWIEVDLSDQKLYAHEGNRIVYQFLVSSGKPWTPTKTGEFRVWVKMRYSKMSGGSKENGTYYYLPNVPFIQYYHRDYGLHGAYWHNNFGHTMSHGCVNLAIPDAEKLFYWTSPVVPSEKNVVFSSKDNPGTRVIIHE